MYVLIEITLMTDEAKLKAETIKEAAIWGVIDRLEKLGKITVDFNLKSEIK